MSIVFARLVLFLAVSGLGALTASAGEMVYTRAHIEAGQDERQVFAWQVLREALERTRPAYGPYVMRVTEVSLLQRRLLQAMDQGGRDINVALLPIAQDNTRHSAFPVRVPVIGGLWGYRVLLVAAERQARFEQVRTLDDLKSVTIGQSLYWADTEILRTAGLQVVTGESYEGLFRMLAAGRFDAFSRSVTEAVTEYASHRDLKPALAIEPHLLLHYPMPEYFWFPGDPAGRRLAQRAEDGLSLMVADGSLCRMVEKAFGDSLRALDLSHRTVIEIPNPQIGPEDHLDEPAYWCNPLSIAADKK